MKRRARGPGYGDRPADCGQASGLFGPARNDCGPEAA